MKQLNRQILCTYPETLPQINCENPTTPLCEEFVGVGRNESSCVYRNDVTVIHDII